jgi:hypothetical protein
VDDIESAVKQIHDAKAAAPAKQPVVKETAPKKAETAPKVAVVPKKISQIPPPSPSRRSRGVEEVPVKKVRLSVDIHPATHKKLKIKAIEQDSDIMHYVEMLIERDLGLA